MFVEAAGTVWKAHGARMMNQIMKTDGEAATVVSHKADKKSTGKGVICSLSGLERYTGDSRLHSNPHSPLLLDTNPVVDGYFGPGDVTCGEVGRKRGSKLEYSSQNRGQGNGLNVPLGSSKAPCLTLQGTMGFHPASVIKSLPASVITS